MPAPGGWPIRAGIWWPADGRRSNARSAFAPPAARASPGSPCGSGIRGYVGAILAVAGLLLALAFWALGRRRRRLAGALGRSPRSCPLPRWPWRWSTAPLTAALGTTLLPGLELRAGVPTRCARWWWCRRS